MQCWFTKTENSKHTLHKCRSTTHWNMWHLFTSPAGALAKYCDEHVCVSVGLSVRDDISRTTRAIFTTFACCLWPWVGPLLHGGVTKYQGEREVLVFPSPLTVHCMGRIAVWISLRRTDLAYIYLVRYLKSRTELNARILKGIFFTNSKLGGLLANWTKRGTEKFED